MLRGRVDPKKEEQDRLQGFLLDMLKEEENKYCADCQAKTPRWAAWNLGIFICIRCAGIHRNLGVHISKVRSVNLDSWTAEQVQTMRVMGNEKARQVYEHDLPAQFRRPTSDAQMEQFIRSKYEQKRYMLRDFSYPKVDVADLTKSLSQFSSKKSVHPVVSISAKSSTQSTNKSGNGTSSSNGITNDLLDFSAPPSSKSAPKTSSTSNFFDDIAGLSIQDNTPKAAPTAINDDFDDFGSFVSATTTAKNTNNSKQAGNFGDFANFSSAPTTAAPSAPVSSNLADLATISEGGSNEQKKSNADILSLFGTTGTTSAAAPIVAPGGFAGFGLQAAPNTILQSSFPAFGSVPLGNQNKNDLYGGLGGVSFGVPNTLSFGKAGSNAPVSNINSLGQQNLFASNKSDAPTSPTGSQGFNIPNKSNAFADLALGKVMKTSYGQSALNPSSTTTTANRTVSPIPSTTSSKPSSNTVSNDLFDMFSNNPPPVPVTVNASSGLDDLLGL